METGQIPPFYRSEPLPGPFREIHRKGHRQSTRSWFGTSREPGTTHPGHHQPELRTPVRANCLRIGAIRRPGSHPAEQRWRWKCADRLPDAIPLPGSRGTRSPAATFRCPPPVPPFRGSHPGTRFLSLQCLSGSRTPGAIPASAHPSKRASAPFPRETGVGQRYAGEGIRTPELLQEALLRRPPLAAWLPPRGSWFGLRWYKVVVLDEVGKSELFDAGLAEGRLDRQVQHLDPLPGILSHPVLPAYTA